MVSHGGGVKLGGGGHSSPVCIWLFLQSGLAHFRGCSCDPGVLAPGEAAACLALGGLQY